MLRLLGGNQAPFGPQAGTGLQPLSGNTPFSQLHVAAIMGPSLG